MGINLTCGDKQPLPPTPSFLGYKGFCNSDVVGTSRYFKEYRR